VARVTLQYIRRGTKRQRKFAPVGSAAAIDRNCESLSPKKPGITPRELLQNANLVIAHCCLLLLLVIANQAHTHHFKEQQ